MRVIRVPKRTCSVLYFSFSFHVERCTHHSLIWSIAERESSYRLIKSSIITRWWYTYQTRDTFPNERFTVAGSHVRAHSLARERERVKRVLKASGASPTRPFTYRRCTTCLLAYRVLLQWTAQGEEEGLRRWRRTCGRRRIAQLSEPSPKPVPGFSARRDDSRVSRCCRGCCFD